MIAVKHGQMNGQRNQLRRRCMMNKNSVLLAIGTGLLFSLFCIDVGLAFQIDGKQNAGTAILPTKHVSNTPTPCAGRTAVTCRTQSRPGSGAMATDGSRYISHISNTPNPCGGRTGAPCTTQSLHGSGATAADGSRYTITTSASAAGMLFGTSLIALVVLGARRLRHPHGHHA